MRREIVAGCDISSAEDIFNVLKATYARDKSTMMARSKQRPDETVAIYLGCLKTELSLIGMYWDNLATEGFLKHTFVNDLLPSVGHIVKLLYPHSLEMAVAQASEIERWRTLPT